MSAITPTTTSKASLLSSSNTPDPDPGTEMVQESKLDNEFHPFQETDWKEDARQEQQEFYSFLGNRKWDFILKTDWTILVRKVAYGIYGPPSREFNDGENIDPNANTQIRPSTDSTDTDVGYTKEQMKLVHEMCKTIQGLGKFRENKEDIWFACIFVCGKTTTEKFTVPVFKTLKRKIAGVDHDYFIDTNCRVYDGWSDYLKSNTLPPCEYCFPRNGTYTGTTKTGRVAASSSSLESDSSEDEDIEESQVQVDYGVSPASTKPAKVLSAMDKVATYVTWGATAVCVAGMCTVPIAGPIAAAAAVGGLTSGVYAAGRSGFSLHDRRTHGQSIGVRNADARNCWLTVMGGALGFAQVRMMSKLAKAAELGQMTGIASKTGQLTFLLVNVGCLSVSGAGLVSNLIGLLEKHEKKQLTKLDILQFSASCLFFTHSLMNFKTAESVIKEVQNDVIDSRRQDLGGKANRNRRYKFNKQRKRNVNENGELAGNAKTVKSINNIRSTQEFYQALVDQETDGGACSENQIEPEAHLQSPKQKQSPITEDHHEGHPNTNLPKPENEPAQRQFDSESGTGSGPANSNKNAIQNIQVKRSIKVSNSNQISNANTNTIITRPKSNTQLQIDAKTKQLIYVKVQELGFHIITSEQFRLFMEDLLKKLEPTIKATIAKLCEYFQVEKLEDIEIGGHKIFAKLKKFEVKKFAQFLKNVYRIYRHDIITLLRMITQLRNIPIENVMDFCVCLVNICLYVQKKIAEYERRYQQGDFDFFGKPELGNLERRTRFFLDTIYDDFKGEAKGVEASLADFEEIIPRSDASSDEVLDDLQNILGIPTSQSTAESNNTGTDSDNDNLQRLAQNAEGNIYSCFNYNDYNCKGSNGNLSDDQYIQIASELIGVSLNSTAEKTEALISHEGDVTFIYFSHIDTSAYGVKIEKIGSGENLYGVVTVLF